MDELTSGAGSIAVAVSALLLVVGYRLAQPSRSREWVAMAAYAAALAAQLLGARGLLPGQALAPDPALRIGGAALLVVGLLTAGRPARARRRVAAAGQVEPAEQQRRLDPVYVGLALVLAGQLARAPSLAGAVATAVAVLACAVAVVSRARSHR